METSHGRSDGRSEAGDGSRVRLGTVGEAPHCGSRTPDIAVFLVRDFAKITFSTTGATQTPAGDRRLRSRAGAGTGYGTQATASRYMEDKFFFSWNRPRRSAELGGKTPPSPERRVPVDSPEDRRFSNRSKSRRRCRHAMETSHGRSDGRSDAGDGSRVRLGTVGEAPHCGSRTPDIAVFLVRDFAKITFSTTGAKQTPAGDRRLRSRAGAGTGYGTQATASRYIEEKKFLLEPTSTTGRARRQDPALSRATRAGR